MVTKFFNGKKVVLEYQHHRYSSFDNAVKRLDKMFHSPMGKSILKVANISSASVSTKDGKRVQSFALAD